MFDFYSVDATTVTEITANIKADCTTDSECYKLTLPSTKSATDKISKWDKTTKHWKADAAVNVTSGVVS